jgi:hypothetical protein
MSKGNFLDFISDAGQLDSVRDQFLDVLYKQGATAEDLLKLFHDLGYEGVSLEDCSKLLRFAGECDIRVPCDFNKKY